MNTRAGGREHVGQAQDELITRSSTLGVVPDSNNSEVSATFTPALNCVSGTTNCSTPQRYVVTYNDGSMGSLMGWATSKDGLTNWKICNAAIPGCGGTDSMGNPVPVPLVNGTAPFLGDPTVVSDLRGHVVYVNLADTDANNAGPEAVAVAVSSDQGRTFTTVTQANADSCSNGTQDQPDATFDFSTDPPTLWVVWRHNGGGTFGGCVRQGNILESSPPGKATIQWLDKAQTIDNMDREETFRGQGGMHIVAGDGAITVMYMNTDRPGDDPKKCPQNNNDQPISAGWSSVTSFTNGQSWTDRTQLFHTTQLQLCLDNDNVLNTIRPFGFARSPTPGQSTYYAAIATERSTIRLFTSSSQGQSWNELDATVPTSPTWIPVPFSQSPAITSNMGDLFFPTVAVDGSGRLAISYYRSRNSDSMVDVRFRGNTNPRDPTVAWQPLLNQSAEVLDPFFTVPPNSQARGLGDYAGMAVGTPTTTCGPAGVFLPAWTSGIGTKGPADVNTRIVNMSFP